MSKKRKQRDVPGGCNTPSELQTPTIPPEYLYDLFACTGADLLGNEIARGNTEREALYGLFSAVMFATIYREAALLHKGCVPSHLNNDAIDNLVNGLQCMRALGAFR